MSGVGRYRSSVCFVPGCKTGSTTDKKLRKNRDNGNKMAIDEIDSETCENTDTISATITIAPNISQLDETEQPIKNITANGTVDIVDYIDEDDVIILEADNPSVLIIDDDNEDNQHNGESNSTNSAANNRLSCSSPFQENGNPDDSQDVIVQNIFDNGSSYPKITPPLRQYGRKRKKSVTTLVQPDNRLSSSSSSEIYIQNASISKTNLKNKYLLSDHSIIEPEDNDGLKQLSEICDLTFCSRSTEISRELDETDGTPIEDRPIVKNSRGNEVYVEQNEPETELQVQECSDGGGNTTDQNDSNGLKALSEISDLFSSRAFLKSENESEVCSSETSSSYLNSSLASAQQEEIIQRIQPTMENTSLGNGKHLEIQIKNDDIEYHLNKIFETYDLTDEEAVPPPPPVVIKMNDTPVIISENGVITVIYKPEKIKFRRKFEHTEPASNQMYFSVEELGEKRTSEKRKKYNSNKKQEAQSYKVRPTRRTKNFTNNLPKIDEETFRLANVKKTRPPGRRWTNKKYAPIRKVNFKGQMVYKCKDCDFVHHSKVAALRRHMIRHQSVDSVEWFYCDLCNYRAKRKGNLKVHMILHRNADEVVWYKCETCDKKFKHKNGLYSHRRRHIRRDELEFYMCDQCPYKSPCKYTLLRHKFNHEPKEKKTLLLCSICSYSTYNKYYLSRHHRHAHGDPIYKCLLCKYEAKYKINLESHMKVHFPQEEILYCDSCDYSTNRRYTLTLHSRNVHNFYNSQDDQTFFCHHCSFETRFKRCLVKHMSMHNGMTESKEILTRIKTEVATD